MRIDTKTIIPISEANQNFSKAAKLADERGSAVIMRNNSPAYVLLPFSSVDEAISPNEDITMAFMRFFGDGVGV